MASAEVDGQMAWEQEGRKAVDVGVKRIGIGIGGWRMYGCGSEASQQPTWMAGALFSSPVEPKTSFETLEGDV